MSAVVYDNGKLIEEYNKYINPDHPIEPHAFNIHGIDEDALKNAPKFSAVADDIINLIKDSEVICHNSTFDVSFLNEEFKRCGYSSVEEISKQITCTLKFARKKYPGLHSHKLYSLANYFDLGKPAELHDAHQDVRLMKKLHDVLSSEKYYHKTGSEIKSNVVVKAPAGKKSRQKSAPANEKTENTPAPVVRLSERETTLQYDEAMLKDLILRLKGNANLRSSHLNALPTNNKKLDLTQLQNDKDFLTTLLKNENFRYEINLTSKDLSHLTEEEFKDYNKMKTKLKTLEIENNDNFMEFGIKNFGFGFPLLIKRSEENKSQVIKAPLFIWNLDIKKSPNKKDTWIIERNEDFPIKVNEVLISYLEKDKNIKIDKIPEEKLDDKLLDQKELIEVSEQILNQINNTENTALNAELNIQKCPLPAQTKDLSNYEAHIHWGGVFSLYDSQKEAIIKRLEELLQDVNNKKLAASYDNPFQKTKITAVPIDPSKEEIIESLGDNEIKVIQGPPGTGKSQCIAGIIANALANNQKTLVVCEKKTALDVIYRNLEKLGLDEYAILINDTKKDRAETVKKSRSIMEKVAAHQENSPASENPTLDEYNEYITLKETLMKKYERLNFPVIGDLVWRELVVEYLHRASMDKLSGVKELNQQKMQYNNQELAELEKIVIAGRGFYRNLTPADEEIFAPLNKKLFSQGYNLETKEIFEKNITALEDLMNKFNERVIPEFEGFSAGEQKLWVGHDLTAIEKEIDVSRQQIAEIQQIVNTAAHTYQDFHKNSVPNYIKRNLTFMFSASGREFRKAHKEYRSRLEVLHKAWEFLQKIPLDKCSIDLRNSNQLNNDGFMKKLEALDSFFEGNKNKINNIIEMKTLCAKFADHNDFLAAPLADCAECKNFNDYITIMRERITGLKKIIQQQDHYPAYHDYENFCRQNVITTLHKELLKNMKQHTLDDWEDIFKAWYYKKAIYNFEALNRESFIKSDTEINRLGDLFQRLRKKQMPEISQIWERERKESLGRFKHNFKALYNLAKNKQYGVRNSLKKIIATDFDMFSDLFPVILTNPNSANTLFHSQNGHFKFVIFDEASQIKLEDGFSALLLGDHKIVVGDDHQMPPSRHFEKKTKDGVPNYDDDELEYDPEDETDSLLESESLLKYAESLRDSNKSYLDFHYRSQHPALIEFSNSSFYGRNLVAYPETAPYVPIDFRNINGEYIDQINNVAKNINNDEVAEIVKILKKEIKADKDGKFPSVGIATTNTKQRNHIINCLDETAEKSPTFAKKYTALKEAGLFIKNLENVQGDERDVIILSTVFGKKKDGKFRQALGNINKIDGYRFINVLVTRAKKKVHVVTSIPKEVYRNYEKYFDEENKNNRRGIFYAYLTYAEAVSEKNKNKTKETLDTLFKNTFDRPRHNTTAKDTREQKLKNTLAQEINSVVVDHKGKLNIDYKLGGVPARLYVRRRYQKNCDRF